MREAVGVGLLTFSFLVPNIRFIAAGFCNYTAALFGVAAFLESMAGKQRWL